MNQKSQVTNPFERPAPSAARLPDREGLLPLGPSRSGNPVTESERAMRSELKENHGQASGKVRPVHFLFSGVLDDGDRDPEALELEAKIVWLSSLAAQ